MRVCLLSICLLLGLSAAYSASGQPRSPRFPAKASETIETGRFRFYETKTLRGEETYIIERAPDGRLFVNSKTAMPFAEQEKKPLVTAMLHTQPDLTPLAFETKGPTLLEIEENTTVVVQDNSANVADRGAQNTRELPREF